VTAALKMVKSVRQASGCGGAGRLQRTSVGVPRTEYANDYEHDYATPFSL
jgi:hypothetical protein